MPIYPIGRGKGAQMSGGEQLRVFLCLATAIAFIAIPAFDKSCLLHWRIATAVIGSLWFILITAFAWHAPEVLYIAGVVNILGSIVQGVMTFTQVDNTSCFWIGLAQWIICTGYALVMISICVNAYFKWQHAKKSPSEIRLIDRTPQPTTSYTTPPVEQNTNITQV